MKRIALVLALILACGGIITFSSCRERVIFPENYISLTMAISQEGVVRQEIDFSLQSEKLQSLGVKPELARQVRSNFLSSLDALRNEFYLSFLLVYSMAPDPNFEIGKSVVVGEVYYQSDLDIAGFIIAYKDVETFQYFQGAKLGNGEQQDQQLLGKNIGFLTKKTVESDFPFAAKYVDKVGNVGTVGERYLAIYKNCFNATLASQVCDKLETPKFVYDYATPYSNIRTNADIFLQGDGLFHNVWVRDNQTFKTCKIRLSSTIVNTGLWYLTLLLALIFLFAITLIFSKLFSLKKKKRLLKISKK